jgi:DNA mismatch repair protein MSH5
MSARWAPHAQDAQAAEDPPRVLDDDVYMAFLWQGGNAAAGRLGVATYDRGEAHRAVHAVHPNLSRPCTRLRASPFPTAGLGNLSVFSQTCPEGEVLPMIDVVKAALGRTAVILTTTALDAKALAALAAPVSGEDAGGAEQAEQLETPVRVLRAAHFALPACTVTLSRVTTLDLLRRPLRTGGGAGASADASLRLGSMIDMQDEMAVRAAGGLLAWLATQRVVGNEIDAALGSGPEGAQHVRPPPGSITLPGAIKPLVLAHSMLVDANTLVALQVFAPASKGRAAAMTAATAVAGAAKGSLKEGFSLCALLDRTRTTAGARLLRTWLRRPLLDVPSIIARQDAVAFLVTARSQAPEAWKALRQACGMVKDLPRILSRIGSARGTVGDWWSLEQTLIGVGKARTTLLQLLGSVRVQKSLFSPATQDQAGSGGPGGRPVEYDTPHSAQAPYILRLLLHVSDPAEALGNILSVLQQVIDWPASRDIKLGTRIVPQGGLSGHLDHLRGVYAGIPARLELESHAELDEYPTLETATIDLSPFLGFLLLLSKTDNGFRDGQAGAPRPATAARGTTALSNEGYTPRPVRRGHGPRRPGTGSLPPGLEFQCETEELLIFKSRRCHALDEEFDGLVAAIRDEEANLTRQLEAKVVQEHGPALCELGAQLTSLDVLASLAEVSCDNGWTRPTMVATSVMLVKGARHPLQEIAAERSGGFVPNDIALTPSSPGSAPIALITGPNGSGKSVYTKLVGLLPILAQVGCFVPAERALLGPVDRIFSRIAALESASLSGLSTFAIDVLQLGTMLRQASPHSLLLIDELGKGTNSMDGVSLLAAAVRALIRRGDVSVHGEGAHPPRTIITTHFREVLDLGLLMDEGEEGATGLSCAPRGVSFFKMDVLLDAAPGAGGTYGRLPTSGPSSWDDEVTCLFKLIPGRAASSYGLACARKAGMPLHVLARASDVSSALAAGAGVPPLGSCAAWATQAHNIATPSAKARDGQARLAMAAAVAFLRATEEGATDVEGHVTQLIHCVRSLAEDEA